MIDDDADNPGHDLLMDYAANIGPRADQVLSELVYVLKQHDLLGAYPDAFNALSGVLASILSMFLQLGDDASSIIHIAKAFAAVLEYNSLLLMQGFTEDETLRAQVRSHLLVGYTGLNIDLTQMLYVSYEGGVDAPI